MSSNLSDAIASQIRRYRLAKNWSVRQLAEECARLGAPQLTASSLTNIERGQDENAKRPGRRVLVEELDVIQRALAVRLMDLHLTCTACDGSPPPGFACLSCGERVPRAEQSP